MSNAAYPSSLRRFAALVLVTMLFGLVPAATPLRAETAVRVLQRATLPPSQPFAPAHVAQQRSQGTVYLPLAMQSSVTLRVAISAADGGTVRAPNGITIDIPANTFPADGYVIYREHRPVSAPIGMRAMPQGFDLEAYTNDGAALHQFAKSISGRVPYRQLELAGSNPASLVVHYFDPSVQAWQPLPSQVDTAQSQVVFTTTHFSPFGLMVASTLDPACQAADVGRGGDPAVQAQMCNAFQRAGGSVAMGVAVADGSGTVHGWGNSQWQDFTGGSLGDAKIIYRNDPGTAFFIYGSFFTNYQSVGGPDSFLGLPISDANAVAPTNYRDRNYNFADQPTMFFDYGFIGRDQHSGVTSAHRNFPQVNKATWNAAWEATNTNDIQGNPQYQFVIRGSVTDAEANPNGKPGDMPTVLGGLHLRMPDGSELWTYRDIGEEFTATLTAPLTQTQMLDAQDQRYQFAFIAGRAIPDDLDGYYPCNHVVADPPENGWFVRNLAPITNQTFTRDCTAGGTSSGAGYDAKPKVSIVEVWPDGHGNLSVKAKATDDKPGVKVALQSSEGQVSDPQMTPWTSDGTDIYVGVIRNVAPGKKTTFTVTATDSAGQIDTVNQDNRVVFSSAFGSSIPCHCQVGDPINTATGNFNETFTDLVVAGRGGTDIIIARTTNSQDERDGPFGRGSSFAYDVALTYVNNPLLQGIQVRYGDGHTANFSDAGGGRYNPVSPSNFDYISADGSSYVLHQHDRTTYIFDGNGKLTAIRNRNGVPITFGYNGAGKLETITNASNRTVTLGWSGDHISSVAATGKTLGYSYNGASLVSFTDANTHTTQYQYDPEGHVIAEITPNTYAHARQEFDDRGRVKWQIVGTSEKRTFDYDDVTRAATVTDANGYQTIYRYDTNYLLASVTDARNHTTYSSYDARGTMKERTDRRGATWSYDYDSNGNVTRQADPLDAWSSAIYGSDVTTWRYDPIFSDVLSTTNALGFMTRYGYDGNGNRTHMYLADGAVITTTYDSFGDPLTITDGRGNTVTNTYDLATGDLLGVIDAEGHAVHFGYDALGRQTRIIDANNHTVTIAYDGVDQITSVLDAKNQETRYVFDPNGNLTDVFDRRNGHTRHTYDQSDRRTATLDPENALTQFGYDLMGHQNVITNARGLTTTTYFDPNYNVSSVRDAGGFWTYYNYDENNNRVEQTNAKRNTTRYVYDANNRLKFEIDPLGHTVEYCYNALDQLVRVFDPARAKTDFEYDALGRIQRLRDALGASSTWAYDRAGNLVAETNGENETTRHEYDRANRLHATLNPLGERIELQRDDVGNVARLVDARGNPTHYGYDANNNVAIITNTRGYTVTFGYDAEDMQTRVSDPEGHTRQFVYNADNMVRARIEPNGQTTQFRYDGNKNLVELINARNKTTTFGYDARDLRTSETDPLNHTTTYTFDELARLISKTDAEGKTYQYTFDDAGRMIRVTDPLTGTTQYAHDAVGNTTAITYANGLTTTFEFNFLNQLKREVDGLNNSYRYDYDRAGRMVRKVDGEWRATSFAYDDAGRLTSTIFSGSGRRVDFSYDANGNETAMRDWNGTLSRQFDTLNRPITVTDAFSRTLVYDWNRDGTRASLTLPGNRTMVSTYNANNQLARLTLPNGEHADYTYDALGSITEQRNSNGTVARYTYDDAQRLSALHNDAPGANPIAWYDYVLDKVGNRTQINEQRIFTPGNAAQNVTRTYSYDELYRLTRAQATGAQSYDTRWNYDAVGNWTGRNGTVPTTGGLNSSGPISSTFSHDQINSLRAADVWHYQYDRNGNRIGATAPITATQYASLASTFGAKASVLISYTYDYEHRLDGVQAAIRPATGNTALKNVLTARYTYDGLGRRVEKFITTTVKNNTLVGTPVTLRRSYVYDGLDPVMEVESQNGSQSTTTYLYRANDQLVALESLAANGKATQLWTHRDGLGSIIALSDAKGTVTTAYRYDEYGQLLAGNTTLNRYTYTQQEWDAETGFYHFYARSYDPRSGIWVEQDTYRGSVDEPLTLHRYGYVIGNPINSVDIYGYYVETAADIAFISYDVYDIKQNGWSWLRGISLAADIAGAAIPFATGGGVATRAIAHGDDIVDATRNVERLNNIDAYDELIKVNKGTNNQVHHLYEKRFATVLGQDPQKMLSIALTKEEHQVFTNAWRKAIPYANRQSSLNTLNASDKQIRAAALQIYKNHPDIIKKLGLIDNQGNLIQNMNDWRRLLSVLLNDPSLYNSSYDYEALACYPSKPNSVMYPAPGPVPTPTRRP